MRNLCYTNVLKKTLVTLITATEGSLKRLQRRLQEYLKLGDYFKVKKPVDLSVRLTYCIFIFGWFLDQRVSKNKAAQCINTF